ncbi:Sugar/inositol transporter [Corchorus olitorius]|uniref:Sugar/inositol transporter n=1 Tax=Corchorus olitorius TaxID=93759 RepID=A0A1R3H8J7_9ROSI|nr:Sugar/inositol transporter [Corchorus olitorius]
MAWFSGKVSLGGFPDLAGAVNKLQESVKNIEKNFDTALGFEEKSESSSNEETSPKVEEKEEAETDRSVHSPEKTTVEEDKPAVRAEKYDEYAEAVERSDTVSSDTGKAEFESEPDSVEPSDSTFQNVESSDSPDNEQQKGSSEVVPSENTDSKEAKLEATEVDQVEAATTVAEQSEAVDIHESTDEQKTRTEEIVEKGSPVKSDESEESRDSQAGASGGPDEPESVSSHSIRVEETNHDREFSMPSALPSDEAQEIVSESVFIENDGNTKGVEVDQQTNDSGTDAKEEQRLSSASTMSVSADSIYELEKLKKEMKMMESALQGAARQAQAKADEIAKLMNENEQLKSVIEDLKRKSNEAEIESLREEYHQRVATLERKVYALTKERDTLRREQNKKSDAAALLKEKDEIINQVMAEGEELSKKQAAQEAQMRKLRAQVEENKVESIKKDKTATEKLLQETIEKHQAELAAQKEFYTNALNAAKEAEALAEARANNEARTELEKRLREAEEREAMLVQTLEQLRETLSRKEQQASFREDMLRRDIEDLQKRYQASERRCEELITQVPESTRPLLRQIEAMQETTSRRAEAWAAVERSLNSRLQEAEAKAAAAEERERSVNERLSQTLSRINVLEAQISCLRAEQTQLSKSLEKERQRAAENRQEYLAAKEEADTQEGRANQLEEEIRELRRKHKQELQDALVHRELLQQEVDKERAARLDLEKTARLHPVAVSEQAPIARHNSALENGSLSRKLSTSSSIGSMEESYYLQASLDSSDGFSERRHMGEATLSPLYMKSMTPSAFESALRQKEGELASYMSRLASMESIRDSLAEELVKMTAQCEKLKAEAGTLPGIRAELEALRRRHSAALELMGERDEELEELRADIVDLKEMYREQVNLLVNKLTAESIVITSGEGVYDKNVAMRGRHLDAYSMYKRGSRDYINAYDKEQGSDGVGRRRAFQLCALPMIIGSSMSATATNLWGMLLGRLFVGTGMGIGPPVAALYVTEISPAYVRGTYGSCTQIATCLGLMGSLFIGLPAKETMGWWRICFWVAAIPAAALALFMEFSAESPHWLFKRGRGADAEAEFEKLLGGPYAKGALAELSKSERGDDADTVKFSELVYGRHRKVIFIGSALFALQQLSGINAVFYFSSIVFKSAGVPSESANICVGIANLLGSFVATLLMDKLGRKAVAMALQATAASSLVSSDNEVYISVGGMLLFVLTFAMGAGPVPGLLLSEMFPGRIRAKAMSMCMAVHWVINFFVGLLFLRLLEQIGALILNTIFATFCLVAVIFVKKNVLETKGKSLQEIEIAFLPPE